MEGWHPDFLAATDPRTLIVYGLPFDAGRVLSGLSAEPQPLAPLTNRYAVIADGMPAVRLSSRGWLSVTPDERMDLPKPWDQYLLCREAILHSASQFAVQVRQFLEAYLDFCQDAVGAHRRVLEPDGKDLFGHEDFVFSAWLPMPRARILLPKDADDDVPAFAEVDVAFWDGRQITAVLIEGAQTPLKSVRRKRDYLFARHPALRVVTVPAAQVRDGVFPQDAFGEDFTAFWRGVDLPMGPMPPDID